MNIWLRKARPESVQFDNSRNGKSRKTVKSKSGTLEIEVPEIAMEYIIFEYSRFDETIGT